MALDVLPPASDPEPASFASTDPDINEIRKMEHIAIADACLDAVDRVFLVSFMLHRVGRVT